MRRRDGKLGFPTAIRLKHSNDLADKYSEFRNTDGSPVEFRVLDGTSMSIMNLPTPIEARFLRLNLVNFTNFPCMRLELMGCQKRSCNDIGKEHALKKYEQFILNTSCFCTMYDFHNFGLIFVGQCTVCLKG